MTPAQVAHIMPPLPKPLTLSRGDEDGAIQLGYTAEQMQAYARAAVEAALRDAPQQAEPTDPEDCQAWCPRCDGTGDEVQMSDSSPDAHEVTVNCRHCDGVGTLYAAYTGVVRELAKKHQAYIKACGEIYFSKLAARPSAPTAVEPDEWATCEWTLEDDDNGTGQSSCGELWQFIEGGPKENRVSFCHNCGKPAIVRASKGTP